MFGTLGAGDGQLNDPTSVAVAGDLVAVADPTNRRIQLFEAGGAFVRSIAVTAWGAPLAYPDVAFSLDGRTLYASSPATAEILAFDLEGRPTGAFRPTPPEALVEPGAIVVAADGSLLVVDHAADRVVRISTGSGPASP
jgi:serine/threonine-protein kinase